MPNSGYVPIRNTDAEPLRPTFNPLQEGLMMQRMQDEKMYRNAEMRMGLQRLLQSDERIKLSAERKNQTDFDQDLNKLNEQTKGLPGGVFFNQLSDDINSLIKETSDEYQKNGFIDQSSFIPKLNKIVANEAKSKALYELLKKSGEDITKTYGSSVDPTKLSNYLKGKLFYNTDKEGKEASLKNISDINVSDLEKTIPTDYKLGNAINANAVISKYIKEIPNITYSLSNNQGNALHSSLNNVSVTAMKYAQMKINPSTGKPEVIIGGMPNNEETRMAIKDNLTEAPLVNRPLYEYMMNTPVGNLANMQVEKLNSTRPKNKQISLDSPEADYIRRAWLYSRMINLVGGKMSVKNSSKETKLGMELGGKLNSSISGVDGTDENRYYKFFNDIKNNNVKGLEEVFNKSTNSQTGIAYPSNYNLGYQSIDLTSLIDPAVKHGFFGYGNSLESATYEPGSGKVQITLTDKNKNVPQTRFLTLDEMKNLPHFLTKIAYGESVANKLYKEQFNQKPDNNNQKNINTNNKNNKWKRVIVKILGGNNND